MIALLVILVVVIAVAMIVPYVASTVARSVVQGLDRSPASGSIDQSLVEARLGRIEEAIDAMALQIERLTEQQRTLLAPAPEPPEDDPRMAAPR